MHDRLLDIAVREFGAKGLAGASTRGIAAAAGTAMSAITYHYGSKQGLYLAAADHVAAGMAGELQVLLDRDGTATADDARRDIHRILSLLLAKMADDREADASLFVIREQMRPTEAFERMYGGMMGRVLATLGELICAATGIDDRHAARIATVTLMGQVLTVRASRAGMLRLLERDRLDDALLADLELRIAANTDAILDRLIADHKGP